MTEIRPAKYFTPKKELAAGKPEAILAYGAMVRERRASDFRPPLCRSFAGSVLTSKVRPRAWRRISHDVGGHQRQQDAAATLSKGSPLMDQTVNALWDARGFKTVMIDPRPRGTSASLSMSRSLEIRGRY